MNYSKGIVIVIINNKSACRRNTITRLDALCECVFEHERKQVSETSCNVLCHYNVLLVSESVV